MLVVAFDPGDTTGIAVWDVSRGQPVLQYMDQVSFEELLVYLGTSDDASIETVIIEDYVLFAKRARQQAGSRMKAPKAIGAIELWATRHHATIVMQQANIKPIAVKWTGIKMPSQHAQTHKYDAYLHGAYWLISQGRLKSKLQKEMENAKTKEA